MPNPLNNSGIRDNHHRGAVADFLKANIRSGSRLSVVSAYFTIYAYDALREHLAAVVAGGSGADRGTFRSRNEERVFAPLSSEAEGSGEGGGGEEVGGTTVLDATHASFLSRHRSHREQPAGGPGRRKLDRRIDWALSHPERPVQKWKTKRCFPLSHRPGYDGWMFA